MRQNFAKGFVDLSRAGLASKAVAKLRLDHVEGRQRWIACGSTPRIVFD